GPLDHNAAAQLCRQLLRPATNVPAAAVAGLVARTGGIPLALVELVRGLKREGLLKPHSQSAGWYVVTDELNRWPDLPSVEWLAERELGSLPAPLAAHARLFATIGNEVALAEVAGVVGELDAGGVGEAFPLDPRVAAERLVALGMMIEVGADRVRF